MCKYNAGIEARKFVRNEAKNIMKAVTREFRYLLQQFIGFREKTWNVIDNINDHRDRMAYAERLVSQTFPVYDNRYRSDPDSPFRLYDCLVPALKEHVRVPEALLPRGYLTDIGLQFQCFREKQDLDKDDIQLLREQNESMKSEITALYYQLEAVD